MGQRRSRMAALAAVSAAAALAVAGCGADVGSAGDDDAEVAVTATTTQVADLVARVGGERVAVDRLLEPNSDPHSYEPRPSDVAALTDADLVVRSGGELDEWLAEVVENAGGDRETLDLSEHVRLRDRGHGHDHGGHLHADGGEHDAGDGDVDPHWWHDPRNALAAVTAIEAALTEVDPAGRGLYRANARAYRQRLRALDRAVAACVGTIPARRRKLVTTHGGLGYFADRYGIELVGALIPSLSTAAQASARDTRELVDRIRATGVPAIFPERALGEKLELAVAREAGVSVGGALWADSLGPEGSGAETYAGSVAANAGTIAAGLGGDPDVCDLDA